MSQSRRPFDPAFITQLAALVQARPPRGKVMSLTAIEDGVDAVMKEIATQLTEVVLAEQICEAEKKGLTPTVAGCPPAGSACATAPSSRGTGR